MIQRWDFIQICASVHCFSSARRFYAFCSCVELMLIVIQSVPTILTNERWKYWFKLHGCIAVDVVLGHDFQSCKFFFVLSLSNGIFSSFFFLFW